MATKAGTGVKRVVHISTGIGEGCKHCTERIGTDRFAESVNHYIEKHGYKLLHVGTESDRYTEGEVAYMTVAVLGK